MNKTKFEEFKGFTTAAIYIRVSTDDQMDLSPESQLIELREYAKKNNILIASEYIFVETEGISGRKSKNRPEFQRMIATAKTLPKPFDCILVWKYSRFARNQDESTFYKSMLRKKLGIDVISASEPIIDGMYGRLMEMIIEWQDEFYSYNLSMEVKRSMRAKASKGEYNGASSFPLGYKADENKLPVINPDEAHIIITIFDLFITGYDKNYIVRHLNDKGYLTKRGKSFTSDTIDYILSNPFYIGKVRWNRRESSATNKLKPEEDWIVSDANHEHLISDEIFEKARERTLSLLAMHDKYKHPVSHTKHWLSGMVKCSICGKSLSWKSGYHGSSNSFQCLGYRRGLHRESQSISERKLTSCVINSLKLALSDNNFTFEVIEMKSDYEVNALQFYEDELKKISMKEERIKRSYMDGIDTIEEYKQNKEILAKRSSELKSLITSSNKKLVDESTAKKQMLANISNVVDILESDCDYMKKANALRSITKNIVFFKDIQTLLFSYYLLV